MSDVIEFSFMLESFFSLLNYVPVTLFLAIASMLLASVLGLLCAIVLLRRLPGLTQLVRLYLLSQPWLCCISYILAYRCC